MIRCIAIDDEPIALSIIEEYCKRHGNIELECFTSPAEGMERIREQCPDIVFLDIELNSHNGLELAHALPQDVNIIFTTAYSQYALDGFNVDAIDFLHKPFFYPRFEQAMTKAMRWSKPDQKVTHPQIITLRASHKNVVLRLDEITYIEAMDNYVKIFRHGLPMVMSQVTMKEMETLLPTDRFLRIHRSYIVAVNAIARFANRKIFLHGFSSPVPVGRKYIESASQLHSIITLQKDN